MKTTTSAGNSGGLISTFATIARLYWTNRQLMWELAKRDINDRSIGTAFGFVWAIVHPLTVLLVYVVVFSFVFRIKFGADSPTDMPYGFATYIITGYLPWMAIAQMMAIASGSIRADATLVKQVDFPLETIAGKTLLVAMWPQLVGTVFLIIWIIAVEGFLSPLLFMLPVIVAIQILLCLGLGWLLAAIGAFFRDVQDLVQWWTVVSMYLMPVVFAPQFMPGPMKIIIPLNPFSHIVYIYQDVIFYGRFENPLSWLIAIVFALICFFSGLYLFQKLKNTFGNVI